MSLCLATDHGQQVACVFKGPRWVFRADEVVDQAHPDKRITHAEAAELLSFYAREAQTSPIERLRPRYQEWARELAAALHGARAWRLAISRESAA